MYAEGNEARDRIETAWGDFNQLRLENDKWEAALYGRHAQLLTQDLDKLGFKTRVPRPSQAIDHHAHDAQEELDDGIIFHAIAREPRFTGRADRVELGASYIWNELNFGNKLADSAKRSVIVAPFAGSWTYWRPYRPPKDTKERDAYDRSFFPFTVEIDPGKQSVFGEDYGRVTWACRKITKSLERALRDYDRKPEMRRKPEQILKEDYPGWRTSYAVGQDKPNRQGRNNVNIWQFDDGEDFCEYIEFAATKGSRKSYELIPPDEEKKPIPNLFGRPSFHFACGHWNPDADRPEDRYQGFLRALTRERYDKDLERSIAWSLLASLPLRVLELPPEALKEIAALPTAADREKFLESMLSTEVRGALAVVGKFGQYDMPLPQILTAMMESSEKDLGMLVPKTPIEQITLRSATASALSLFEGDRKVRYGAPRRNFTAMVHDIIQDCFQFYRRQEGSALGNTPSSVSTVSLYGRVSESMRVKGKSLKAGTAIQLGPDELGDDASWYDLEVSLVDMKAQAVNARRAAAAELKQMGAIDDDQWVEMLDFEDAEAQLTRLKIQKLKNLYEQPTAAVQYARALEYRAYVTGSTVDQQIALANGGPVAGPGGPAAPPAPIPQGMQPTVTVGPPQINDKAVTLTA